MRSLERENAAKGGLYECVRVCVVARAPTHKNFPRIQVFSWHAANARAAVRVVALRHALQAAQALVAWLFPLCNQRRVRVALLQAKVVHLPRNRLLCVKHVVHVARALMRDAEHGPERLGLALALVRLALHLAHAPLEGLQRGLHSVKAIGHARALGADLRHLWVHEPDALWLVEVFHQRVRDDGMIHWQGYSWMIRPNKLEQKKMRSTRRMRRFFSLAVLWWSAVAVPPFRQGFSYTTYSSGTFSEPSSAHALSLLASPSVGVRSVEIMATYFVDNSVNSTAIHPTASSPTDADVGAAIRDALAAGLTPVLKPHIDCLDGVWRANIGTKFTTEAQWAAWFGNYTTFITHFAGLAALHGATAGFNLGTELDGTHHREADWRLVVAAVRAVLPPPTKLWLGPNWDWLGVPGYTLVGFWDALDFLGVDMYPPLASHPDPTLDEAMAGWAPIVANLSAFSAAHGGKQFIFAEIGFASWQRAAVDAPGCCAGPPDPATQGVLYASFFQAVYAQPWLGGVFWWAWSAGHVKAEPCATDFEVLGKPAQAVLASHYLPGARGGPQPLVVYDGGANPPTAWDNWSFNARVNLTDTSDPYPGHPISILSAITAAYGALALHALAPQDVSPFTVLRFNIRAPNTSAAYALAVYLCFADDCDGNNSGPQVSVDAYAPASAPCTVPASWDVDPGAARVAVPLPVGSHQSCLMPWWY